MDPGIGSRPTTTADLADAQARPAASEPGAQEIRVPRDEADVETDDREDREDREDGDRQELAPLLAEGEGDDMRDRWHRLQADFVDDPQRTVEEADQLVAELMQRLAQMFTAERQALEGQWGQGQQVSTEDLRIALQRYRSFFERLLSA